MPKDDFQQFQDAISAPNAPWSEARFLAVAVKGKDVEGGAPAPFEVLASNLILQTPGIENPNLDEGEFVRAETIRAVHVSISKEQLLKALDAIRQDSIPDVISSIFTVPVRFPAAAREARWSFGWDRSGVCGWPHFFVKKWLGIEFHKIVGHDNFARSMQDLLYLGPRPFDGLSGLAKLFMPHNANSFQSNSGHPILYISAPVPLSLDSFKYDRRDKGYRLTVSVGKDVHRGEARVAVHEGPQTSVPLSDS